MIFECGEIGKDRVSIPLHVFEIFFLFAPNAFKPAYPLAIANGAVQGVLPLEPC